MRAGRQTRRICQKKIDDLGEQYPRSAHATIGGEREAHECRWYGVAARDFRSGQASITLVSDYLNHSHRPNH
jgi:hypothetical protein